MRTFDVSKLMGNVEIVLVKGKLEDVALPVDKVDIIISEVCGYLH
jgi:hypothetical protein